jgi:Flp pilus assembly pilin Flp
MKLRRSQRGQSALEYTVVCLLIFAALFTGQPSVAQQLADSVRSFYRSLTYFVSLS